MLIQTLVNNLDTAFKVKTKLQYPTLFVAEGLSGAEVVTFDATNQMSTPDETNDADWIALLLNGNQLSLTATSNYIFAQAPAWYRLVLNTTPAAGITIMQFIYT